MPRTIIIEEFKEIDAPADLLLSTGEISVFPSIVEKNFFSIRYKKGKPVFQAGGYVGIIPINSSLLIDIRPKVPISNLERIVFVSNYSPKILKEFKRKYDPHTYSSVSLSEFIIDCFLRLMEELCVNGLVKDFAACSSTGLFPKGRINFSATIRARSKSNDSRLVTQWYDRSVDTIPNQFLKSVVKMLLSNRDLMTAKDRKRAILYIVNHFSGVTDRSPYSLLFAPPIVSPLDYIPSTKETYPDAIALAKMIVDGKGLSYQNGSAASASALVLDLASAFESYVLAILESGLPTPQFKVLNGNLGGVNGGKRRLLEPSSSTYYTGKKVDATPDIVIEYIEGDRQVNIVVDVKYKSISSVANRDDLNQIISYAASYNSVCGILIFPANSDNKTGMVNLGKIRGVEFYQYFMDLGRPDIESEESVLVKALAEVIDDCFSQIGKP